MAMLAPRMRKWGALEAFHFLGADARDKFAWSAQSADGSITVLTLWDDQLDDDGTTVIADVRARPGRADWVNEPRNKRRIAHLKTVWAGSRQFRVVMLSPKDPAAVPRSTRSRWPDDALSMTLTAFDPETGEFRAEGQRSNVEANVESPVRRKYAPLGRYLRQQTLLECRLTLDEIGDLVGGLPESASTPQFWANVQNHQLERRGQWLEAGYEAFYEPAHAAVRFVKVTTAASSSGQVWTDDELRACVQAYRSLWLSQQQGMPANKAAMRRLTLETALKGRSDSAYEMRLQNVSSVVAELGLPIVSGYQPLHNIGTAKFRLIRLINEAWDRGEVLEAPTADEDELQTRIVAAKQKLTGPLGPPPPGATTVARKAATTGRFARDANVIAWVLKAADGICEVCSSPAPFKRADGSPFLEVHHVRPLAEGGPDKTCNAVAGCPNCHRRLHDSADREQLRTRTISRVSRLKDYPKIKPVQGE